MKNYFEPTKSLPIIASCDVLVVGGGSAGCSAAIAAGRAGSHTLLIEQFGFLGGTSTGALVTPMMANHIQKKPLNQGIYLEVLEELLKTSDADVYKDGNAGWFNPEMLKIILENFVINSGVQILYHSWFSDVIIEDKHIKGIIIENKSGRSVILSKRIIDTTGDADVAFKAGVPIVSGRSSDAKNQPMSLRFNLANVDLKKAQTYFESLGEFDYTDSNKVPLWTTAFTLDKSWPLKPVFEQAVREKVLKKEDLSYFQIFTIPGRPGEIAFNCPRIDNATNATDHNEISRVQIEGKKKILRYYHFCKKYLKGFENAYIAQIAPMVGVRESRRIIGEYVLSSKDFYSANKFEDAIARNNYPIDIHSNDGKGGLYFIKKGDYHDIPYRCLIPLEIENLLVAGRCLSADFEAQGAVRIIPNCYAMGQAAGLACHVSISKDCNPRKLPFSELKKALISATQNRT